MNGCNFGSKLIHFVYIAANGGEIISGKLQIEGKRKFSTDSIKAEKLTIFIIYGIINT